MKVLLMFLMFNLVLNAQNNCDFKNFEKFRNEINEDYKNPSKSPLQKKDLENFKSLDFFEYSEKYCVKAQLIRTPNEKPFQMQTSTDRLPMYVKFGEAHFEIDNVKMKLNIYQSLDLIKLEQYKDYLFLPFSDLSSGNQTYIGGRYLDLKISESDEIIIDFNLAYNPYCAYNYKYSCPKVPLENDLPIEILAGVKKFD